MSTPLIQVLEELTWVAPFGVRFWDVTTMAPASAGLSVVAYPNAIPERRTTAGVNNSGVYFFRDLPGMRRFANGSGDDDFWAANPPQIPFTFEVRDTLRRYLPYQFTALLPFHGLYGMVGSPLSFPLTPDATWLPIFSAPARAVPGPAGLVRVCLTDDTAHTIAPWALITAQAAGALVITGMADYRGVATVTVPYPEPRNSPFASPLGTGSLKLSDQTWPLTVSIFYTPPTVMPDPDDDSVLPDLEDILNQRLATAWQDTAHATPAGDFTLKFGEDLVLRSRDSGTGRQLPVLLITPA